jgi:hypothetical protein
MSTTVKRPEPVLEAGKIAGAIAAVLLAVGGLLRTIGWLPVGVDVEDVADQASTVVLAIGVLWAAVGPWLTNRLRARDLVTPMKDPRDAAGNPLMSPQVALLTADFPEYAALIPATLGAGGMTYDVVHDYLQTLRDAADKKRATAATAQDPDGADQPTTTPDAGSVGATSS